MIVADVNLIAYLLIEGEYTAAAQSALARDPAWAAPLLWRSEWRNVLAGYLRRGELDLSGAMERVITAESLVRGLEFVVDSTTVMDLVARSTHSAYDCEYVALADHLGVPLVTNDQRLVSAFPDRVVALAEFVGG